MLNRKEPNYNTSPHCIPSFPPRPSPSRSLSLLSSPHPRQVNLFFPVCLFIYNVTLSFTFYFFLSPSDFVPYDLFTSRPPLLSSVSPLVPLSYCTFCITFRPPFLPSVSSFVPLFFLLYHLLSPLLPSVSPFVPLSYLLYHHKSPSPTFFITISPPLLHSV